MGCESARGLKWLCKPFCKENGGLSVLSVHPARGHISSRGTGKDASVPSHLVKQQHVLSEQRGSEKDFQCVPAGSRYRIPRVPVEDLRVPMEDPQGAASSAHLRRMLLPGAG